MGHRTQIESSPISPTWLIRLLRGTLKHLEQDLHFAADDPAVRDVKSSIVRAIAELQVHRQAA